ncbi:MAG: methyltransferase domain-containing protein [Peptococcaceae bacterium]|nr:methyltransferase domain-containing protein [Peptococcaceae bacterium]
MAVLNQNSYMQFERERSMPALDLAMRIEHDHPEKILDIGCGQGNSTNILSRLWKDASIIGIDNSPSMLSDLSFLGKFDIIFSNAVFQRIPQNDRLIPKLFSMLNPDGVLAVQVPFVKEMLIHEILLDMIETPKWSRFFKGISESYKVFPPDFYYDVLYDFTPDIQLWETRYYHVMDGFEDLLYWYESAGLKPYLDCLPDQKSKTKFQNELLIEIMKYYPANQDGKILFPFHRVFFIANNKKIAC